MRIARLLVPAVGFCSLLIAGTAQAGELDACGDFFFDPGGDVSCEVVVSGGCDVACEPISFEVECAAELYVGCEGGCDVEIDAGCSVDCEAGCEASCSGGEFDCQASCEGNCSADCDARCASGEAGGECRASCQANCSGSCSASCDVEAPDCMAECSASCQGECHAEANAECQIDCQAEGYIDCKADLQGGCEVACESPEGAVFCDGQWINTDDFDACIEAIQEAFDIEVEGYAEASCDGNTCTAEAGCSASTVSTMEPTSNDYKYGMMAVGLGVMGLFGARRRNRKK